MFSSKVAAHASDGTHRGSIGPARSRAAELNIEHRQGFGREEAGRNGFIGKGGGEEFQTEDVRRYDGMNSEQRLNAALGG